MRMRTWFLTLAVLLATLALCSPWGAAAQGFSAYVAPARLEIKATPGETTRQVLEIHQASQLPGRFRLYTNDWDFKKPNDALVFSDALAPDSCRPWVALERREITVQANSRYRFRFEISPPADTPPRECRFAIMVEGLEAATVDQGGFRFPVAGRLGVIVYVAVGGVEARLAVANPRVVEEKGEKLPVIDVSNTGTAHGRLEGFLTGVDASGKEFELAADDAPILPDRTRTITLRKTGDGGSKGAAILYPLTVKGTLEWGKQRESLELRFQP